MKTTSLFGALIALLAALAAFGAEDKKSYPVAIWLVPAPEQQRQLQGLISDLAAQHSSAKQYVPTFQPHMTLCSGTLQTKDFEAGLRQLIKQINDFADGNKKDQVEGQQEISLAVNAERPIDQRTEDWSRFLFIVLDADDKSQILAAQKQEIANNTFKAISPCAIVADNREPQLHLMPHISLMYSAGEDSFPHVRQEVEVGYDFPKQIIFQSIQAVAPISGNWRDILKENPGANGTWKVLYSKNLQPVKPLLRMVLAGGQTGVDQAAWRAARLNRIVIGGWCPPHRDIGSGNSVPAEFPCQETPNDASADAPDIPRSQRTEWNVRDSDATLILRGLEEPKCVVIEKKHDLPKDVQNDIDECEDRGTGLTVDHALKLSKHAMICDPSNLNAVEIEKMVSWIKAQKNSTGQNQPTYPITLNVGGPSEATEPGVGARAEQFLLKVFARLRNESK